MEHLGIRGISVPRIGLGTWALRGETCEEVVAQALELGYRHFDTAEMYRNETEIGRALKRAGVPREELFLTSKVWRNHMHYDGVLRACEQSLTELGTDYLDLYLIHWPNPEVPIEETVSALDELQRSGRARCIGLSNFGLSELRAAQAASRVGIFCNQVEFNPWEQPTAVLEACQAEDVLVMAYTPLARGRVQRSEDLRQIGDRFGKTPVQEGERGCHS
jgi:2,5-diketo-D-gluconate reductase B